MSTKKRIAYDWMTEGEFQTKLSGTVPTIKVLQKDMIGVLTEGDDDDFYNGKVIVVYKIEEVARYKVRHETKVHIEKENI